MNSKSASSVNNAAISTFSPVLAGAAADLGVWAFLGSAADLAFFLGVLAAALVFGVAAALRFLPVSPLSANAKTI